MPVIGLLTYVGLHVIGIVANMGEGKKGRSFFGLHCRCDAPTRQARRAESTAG